MPRQGNLNRRARQRRGERGSALLVVLVFAAIIAIMLYRELPIAAFEAQRQKEQLLISRGNQYKRGVKLFVRKVGRFPSSIDELENTNRMRFLRHRFVDPLTGKEDWRLIHAGPGGVILDSKIASSNNKNASALGQGATFAGFNNSFNGDKEAVADLAAASAPSVGMRQRPPATRNASNPGNSLDPLAQAAGNADPSAGIDSNNLNGQQSNGAGNMAVNLDPVTGQQLPPTMTQNNNASGSNSAQSVGNAVTNLADQLNNTNPRVPEQSGANGGTITSTPGLGNTSAFGGSTPGTANGSFGNQGPNQSTAGGGIAGVASIAGGKGIKTVHDQSKYKLWEFYYDMRQDQNQGLAAAATAQPNTNGATGFGGTAAGQGSSSGFGQSNSGFGQSNGGFGQSNGGFGQSNGGFGQSNGGFGQSNSGFGQSNSTIGNSGGQTVFGNNPTVTTNPQQP